MRNMEVVSVNSGNPNAKLEDIVASVVKLLPAKYSLKILTAEMKQFQKFKGVNSAKNKGR